MSEVGASRGWRRWLAWPRELWNATALPVDSLFPRLGHRSRRAVRVAFFVAIVLCLPFLWLFNLHERSPMARVRARALEIWSSSPEDSLAFVRDVYQRLDSAERAGIPLRRVEIPSVGRMAWNARLEVALLLYEWLWTLGRFEEARVHIASLPACVPTVLSQVDCLVALHRTAEAVALLEANLSLDNRGGALRARLATLRGPHLRVVE